MTAGSHSRTVRKRSQCSLPPPPMQGDLVNLFGSTADPSCRCLDVAGLAAAAFACTDPEPCPVHQADELARRQIDADRQADRQRLEDALDRVKADDELAARRQVREEREASIDGIADPLERALVRLTDRRPTLPFPTDGGDAA